MSISAPELLTADHDLSAFDCGKAALNDWLKTHALNNQTKGFTRVLVVHEAERVVGFYGVAPTAIPPSALSRSVRTGRAPDPVPCILLGQFAVDKDFMGRGIGGALLKDALARCVTAADAIGGRAVIVRAIDKDAERGGPIGDLADSFRQKTTRRRCSSRSKRSPIGSQGDGRSNSFSAQTAELTILQLGAANEAAIHQRFRRRAYSVALNND